MNFKYGFSDLELVINDTYICVYRPAGYVTTPRNFKLKWIKKQKF